MKTIAYWGMTIRARWFKTAAFGLLAAAALSADTNESRLGQGVNAYNLHDYGGAIQHLRGVQIPRLADYIAYYLGSSELQTGDIDGAVRDLTAYRAAAVSSTPLAGKISLTTARALLDQHNAASNTRALDILQTDYKYLPQPDGDFALAMAYEAQGEKLQASLSYVKVYYGWPNTDLAARSWDAMTRLKTDLGKDFPSAPPASNSIAAKSGSTSSSTPTQRLNTRPSRKAFPNPIATKPAWASARLSFFRAIPRRR